ncbi:AlbA family DNA-binding domain-containing protein [Rhizobium leguminosarum]|uniref:AlbA family DNA-binding domain-containing protein n=1 Tax=Rhizobium leguminosarum TaxID=384 RepID=UPI003F97DAE8
MSSASVIAQKPLSELSLDDLESLVEIEAAESDQLELKRDLPISNDAKGWRESGKLHKNETRAIAIEVVALANGYGGRVYIGIEESSDDPKRAARMASALPNVASLSERLGDGLNGLISPPIRGLALKAIADTEGSDDGFLVIDVPRSLEAPHGVGVPPQCYWRRGSTAQPMEMRDLQNLFWETRTRMERIRFEQQESVRRYEQLPTRPNAINYRFTLVSVEPLALKQLTQNFRNGTIVPIMSRGVPAEGVAEYPLGRNDIWTFAAFGTAKSSENLPTSSKHFTWAVDETGVIEVIGTLAMPTDPLRVDPYDFCATAAHLLYLASYVHRFASQSLDQWVLDGEIQSTCDIVYGQNPADYFRDITVNLRRGALFRPLALSLEQGTEEVFAALEERIWAAFGQAVVDQAKHPYQRPARLA